MELELLACMELRRSDWAYSVTSIVPCSLGLNLFHRIYYSGAKNIPKEGPALLLPKHQVQRDIPITGMFLKYKCQRYGSWVMAPWIPRKLQTLGGIPIYRPKDMKAEKEKRKSMSPEQKKASKEKIKSLMKDSMGYIEWLYANREMVVVHLEGERFPNEMGPMNMAFIKHAREMEEKYSIRIPAVPIGIEYESFNSLDSRVWLRAGRQLSLDTPGLENVLRKEISRLSNL